MSRVVFLVNPASDNGRTGKVWAALAHRAAGLGLDGETIYSERAGHLIEVAAAVDADVVVAVGGDGTLNEVVNGLMQRAGERPVLATIPIGTGMDFVRTYGIPNRFEDAVGVAAGEATRTIDVGRVEHSRGVRFYVNVGSVGMSGAVAARVNGMPKPLGGKATYFYALTRVFFEWRNTPVTVELADGTTRTGAMHDVIVANGKWHGGAMLLAPDAEPDDGAFDVVLIGDVNKRDFVTTAPKIYKGTYLAHPKVELLRSSSVAVDAPERLPIELDGEQVGTTPARFEVVPHALRVRVP
ncbi:MAG: diacylglycerol kinase family protein [Actinomycetota bacterium]